MVADGYDLAIRVWERFRALARAALLAVDASGRRVARLTLPAAITVMEIGEDYVLGRLENEDGEHALVVYGLRRGS